MKENELDRRLFRNFVNDWLRDGMTHEQIFKTFGKSMSMDEILILKEMEKQAKVGGAK